MTTLESRPLLKFFSFLLNWWRNIKNINLQKAQALVEYFDKNTVDFTSVILYRRLTYIQVSN